MYETHSPSQRLLFCRAVANLSAADGRFVEGERAELDDLVYALGFDPEDPVVQRAVATELMAPGPIGPLVAGIRADSLRFGLLCKLVDVAWIDDELHPAERSRLVEVCATFGFEPAWVDDLHAFFKAPPLDAPAAPTILQAAVTMAGADGVERPAERRRLTRLAAHLGLGPAEVAAAEARADTAPPPRLASRAARLYLLRVLIEVVLVDGEVHPAERAALAAAGAALELTPLQTDVLVELGLDLGRSDRALLG
ncbi:MAG: hypothetical protein H6706_17370 [Myxococcales bacterium]|nr:hypothetical protein [Myxococcales bacterium]